jgi:hypothetical protein
MLLRHICKLIRDDEQLDIAYDTVSFDIYINNQKAQATDLTEKELEELTGFIEFRHLKLNTGRNFRIDHYGPPSHLL